MKYKLTMAFCLLAFAVSPASAQMANYSQAATGTFGRTSYFTNNLGRSNSVNTMTQTPANALQPVSTGILTRITGGPRGINGLPETKINSFVKQSGYDYLIYSNEGTTLPPINEFEPVSRIQRGNLSDGLSTGHGSMLHPGVGGDERVDYEPPTMSGPRGGYVNTSRGVNLFGINRPDMEGDPAPIGSSQRSNRRFIP